MNLFRPSFACADPLLEFRVRAEADDKFGSGDSYVKNVWTALEYKDRGGVVECIGSKECDGLKSFVEDQMNHVTNNWFINSQIEYACEFLNEDAGWKALSDLLVLYSSKFSRRSFERIGNLSFKFEEVSQDKFFEVFSREPSPVILPSVITCMFDEVRGEWDDNLSSRLYYLYNSVSNFGGVNKNLILKEMGHGNL